jgi:hypothetical protein
MRKETFSFKKEFLKAYPGRLLKHMSDFIHCLSPNSMFIGT